MELHLDKVKSSQVQSILNRKFWPELYPELAGIFSQAIYAPLTQAQQIEIGTKIIKLLREWGVRQECAEDLSARFIFEDDAAYVKFILVWG